jgi:CBS domain containing-hemolysin-like protein
LAIRDFPTVSIWIPVAQAIDRRPTDFEHVHTCRLTDSIASLFLAIQKGKVSRFIVINADNKVKGVVALSDILSYLLAI